MLLGRSSSAERSGAIRRRGEGELFLASDLNMEAYNKLCVI